MDRRIIKVGVVVASAFLLLSCTTVTSYVEPNPGNHASTQMTKDFDEAIAQNKSLEKRAEPLALSPSLSKAMLPELQVDQSNTKKDHKFDLSVKDIPAQTFFLGLVKDSPINIVVSPKLEGNITLDLKSVTIPEVLDVVHDLYGYQVITTDYGYEVLPAGLQTKVFRVSYLDVKRTGKSNTFVSSGQLSGGSSDEDSQNSDGSTTKTASSVDTESESNFWASLQVTLDTMVGVDRSASETTSTEEDGDEERTTTTYHRNSNASDRRVIVNPESNSVIVRADAEELKEVADFLDDLESTVSREVIIDAKVMEVILYDAYQAGIDWSFLTAAQSATGNILASGNDTVNGLLDSFTSVFTGTVTKESFGDFSAVINLLSAQGNVQVLSSPRIATVNNQKAVIKVGQDEFFITNVSSTITGSASTTETTQDIDLTPFFTGVALDVTPEISPDNQVILHIHPIVSDVRDQSKTFVVSGQSQELPLALSNVRESDSIVTADSGQIIVIGGLMQEKTTEATASTPFLDKLPFVGPLFRRTTQLNVKTELVILLKPTIVDHKVWTKETRKAKQRIESVNRGFSFGPHPDVFGNKGEKWIWRNESSEGMSDHSVEGEHDVHAALSLK